MHLFGLPGLLALGLGVAIGLWLSAEKLFAGAKIGTRPLLLLAVLLVVLGAQFFGLGLLGEYLAHGQNARSRRGASNLQPFVREALGLDQPQVVASTADGERPRLAAIGDHDPPPLSQPEPLANNGADAAS
jgi:hypothetical protein